MNRPKIKSTLLETLTGAGKILKTTISQRKITAKKSELSLVTESDEKSEKFIVKTILKNFPDHSLLTEESPARGHSSSRWIIDPLDGTTNFAHTFPIACVSIAYEENGEVLLGGILDPFRNELFFGERGKGATLNGKKIRVSKTPLLNDSLLCTGFPYDRREKIDEYLPLFRRFVIKTQGMRRLGAAALDLCYVACGRYDGYWEAKLNPWDKAAAMVIVEEAGGQLSNFSGEPLTLEDVQNVASNGKIHQEMLEVMKPYQRIGKS
ncbi:MAG: inositol monophosphatase [Candidatus Omnitrophica bacterium]|nr:inositol monophosphatase [Candidatus Omnitrophota bacterium]